MDPRTASLTLFKRVQKVNRAPHYITNFLLHLETGMNHGIDRIGGGTGGCRIGNASPRRISGASSISGYYSDDKDGSGKHAQVITFFSE